MKSLNGWRTLISAVVWITALLGVLATGRDLTPVAQGIAKAMNWETPAGETLILYGLIANSLFALWGVAGRAVKAWRQRRAGATLGELFRPIGVVKAALADGTLSVASPQPATLVMTSDPGAPLAGDAVALVVRPTER